MMDISETLAPTSDQLDAIELVSGPRIFEVESVSKGSLEQPVNIHFKNFPRPWRPSKGMRRALAYCWGADASVWAGHRVELFYDPEVTFGKEKPGGTRIKRMSHIDEAKRIPLLVARGRSAIFTVEPLPDAPAAPTEADVAASTDTDLLRSWWTPNPNLRSAIEARVAEIKTENGAEPGLFEGQQ